MVGVALVVRPVGVAAADARQRHDHRRDDDGGELGGLNTLGRDVGFLGGPSRGFTSSDGFVTALPYVLMR